MSSGNNAVTKLEEEAQPRFNILLCIDGSEESKRGLKYAIKLGKGNDADITLLYVRPNDRSTNHGVDLARKNMLDWGFELPGMRALKDARDQLIQMGFLGQENDNQPIRKRAYGDPARSSMKIYTHACGTNITIKSTVAASVSTGILSECELNDYDLTIIAMAGREARNVRGKINWRVTKAIFTQHDSTVLLAREIRENHGHLICIRDDNSIEAARKDAILANRCDCPVHLISVAPTPIGLPRAKKMIEKAKKVIVAAGVPVVSSRTVIGPPAREIIKHGREFSVIVMADTSVGIFKRLFKSTVPYQVLKGAENSVMIIR